MEDTNGIRIYKLKAWDYAGLCQAFEEGIQRIRDTHVPVLFHVEEVTQPQGHSTSGSHERYKTPERLAWEKEWDCIKKMKEWMLANNLSNESELSDIEAQAKDHVRKSRQRAWDKYINPIKEQAANAGTLLKEMMVSDMDKYNRLQQMANELLQSKEPLRRDVLRTLSLAIELAPESPSIQDVQLYYQELLNLNKGLYNTHLYNQTIKSALKVPEIKPLISFDAPTVNGFEVLNKYFDALLTQNPKVYAFGEDVGYIGDVNQGFAGLQEKHGRDRIFDTGIRELTIMGQV